MRKSLYWKLTIAFVLVAIATATLVAVFIRITSVDRLSQLIIEQERNSLEEVLINYYSLNHSWEGIRENWNRIQYQNTPVARNSQEQEQEPVAPPDQSPSENTPPNRGPSPQDRRELFGLADIDGKVIVPVFPNYPEGHLLTDEEKKEGTTITVDGEDVGIILTLTLKPRFNPAEDMFLQRTNQALMFAILGALVVAVCIGILLARTLTRPLRALTNAAQNIAEGQLEQQVPVTSQDEIGQLAAAFNRMSQEVARVNHLRRQMTADIAHDLRTPLTVIAGYIESMRDGVLNPTTQRLSLIYTEIEHLQHLVNDLRILSQADAGELPLNPQQVSPRQFLEHAAELFTHHASQNNVTLIVEVPDNLPDLYIDEARFMQVIDNLISNALRYTPAGGTISLCAREENGKIEIAVKDTGIGIAAEELPYIFDRFHRADKSRHSDTGESGLGLAIVKAMVEAHKGRVWAESHEGVGTAIYIEIPAASR